MKKKLGTLAALAVLSFGVGDIEIAGHRIGAGLIIGEAQARVGRPVTPVSVAGVARRTTRRAIYRGAYVSTLPARCPLGSYYGYSLYYCGGVYYQPSGGRYVIVRF